MKPEQTGQAAVSVHQPQLPKTQHKRPAIPQSGIFSCVKHTECANIMTDVCVRVLSEYRNEIWDDALTISGALL